MSFHTIKKQLISWKKRIFVRKNCRYLPFILIPFLCFYCLEFYTHDPWLMEPIPQLINYLFFFSCGILVTMLTGRSWCGTSFLVIYSLTAGCANYFVMDFRNNPILPWDLKSVSTAIMVSDNYTFELNYRFYISTIVLLILLITGILIRFKIKLPFRSWKRLTAALSSSLFLLLLFLGMMQTAVTDRLLTPTNLFTQWASYRDNGFTVTFIQNLQYLNIRKPAGYDPETLDQELQTFLENHTDLLSETETISAEITDSSEKKPDIIVIMNESFSDLAVLHDFETDEDYMPYIHSLQKQKQSNLITGSLFVSVCGGNTANSEFEFLTGNTMAFLPPGSVPYQQYLSGDLTNMASLLAADGYETTGIHPYSEAGWNRRQVYPWLGFQNQIFRSQFHTSQLVRKYISDQDAFQKIQNLYEADAAEKDLFLFEVTMQNHGGYSQIYDNFPIQVHLKDIQTASSPATENYLSLIQASDQAFQELIEYYETKSEPVIILMFGDHQPNDYAAENIASLTGTPKENRTLKEAQNRYIVPYIIWSNYDLEKEAAGFSETASVDLTSPVNENTLSINYLNASFTRLCGQELTDYQKFLLIMKKTLPVITANVVIDSDGNYMTVNEAKKQYPELMGLYEKLQYQYLFE